jgi:hypothetical protein
MPLNESQRNVVESSNMKEIILHTVEHSRQTGGKAITTNMI